MAKESRQRRAHYKKDQSGCITGMINDISDFFRGRSSQKVLQDNKPESKRITEAAYPNSKLESLNDPTEELCEYLRSLEEKEKCKRVSCTFSFSKLKSEMKHVMRKPYSDEHQNNNLACRERRVGGGETMATASLSRGRFCIEKLPKSLLKIGKPKDDDTHISPEQRVLNISPREQVSRSLGELMSFPGYTSTLPSPGKDRDMIFSSNGDCQMVENTCQVKQDSDKIHLQIPMQQESGIENCINGPTREVDNGLPDCEINVEKATHGFEVLAYEDNLILPNGEPQIKNKPTAGTDMQVDSPPSSKCFRENSQPARLAQDSCTESEPSSSSEIASSLTYLLTEKSKDQELKNDATRKPSPISVVQPLFSEDDISPHGIDSLLTGEIALVTMAKESRQRRAHYKKDQSGCITGLINDISDFFRGRSSQKVLQDNKPESKRITDAAYPNSKLESLNDPTEELCEYLRSLEEKEKCKRVSCTFSFSKLKSEMKHVMRKPYSDEHQNNNLACRERRVGGGETMATASLSRGRFCIEKLPKSLLKIGKPKDDDTHISPEQRVLNISPREQVSRSLGELMSFPGYTSTLRSPEKDRDMIFSSNGDCQMVENTCQVKQDSDKIHLQTPMQQESGIENCINGPTREVDNGLPDCEINVEKATHGFEVLAYEDNLILPNGEPQIENKPTGGTDMQVDSPPTSKCSRENNHWERLGQDSCSESESLSSSEIASNITYSVTKSNDVELTKDATSKPSPISVLEPLFVEDEISPHGIKSLLTAIGSPVQPRQIKFDEETEEYGSNRAFDFVKEVVQKSGLTWEEAHGRTFDTHTSNLSAEPSSVHHGQYQDKGSTTLRWILNPLFDDQLGE